MSTQTDPEELYDTLRAEGLFEAEGEHLKLTDDFRTARERRRGEFDETADAEGRIAEYVDGTPFSVEDVDEWIVADAMAVQDTCETIDAGTSVHVALSLDRSESVESDGHVPSGFVSIAGEEIESFLDAHPASIVYCWREDCEPCDAVRRHLEDLRERGAIPDGIGLGAIYGPDNARVLSEEYDIGGSPTTLFCSGTRIESRCVGNPGPNGLQREIDLLAEGL